MTNVASGTHEQAQLVVEMGMLPVLKHVIEKSGSKDVVEQAVWCTGNIAGDSYHYRDQCLDTGLMPLIVQRTMQYLNDKNLSFLRNAVWTVSNLCRGKPAPELQKIQPCFPLLRTLVYYRDADVLMNILWTLSYVTEKFGPQVEKALQLDRDFVTAIVMHCK